MSMEWLRAQAQTPEIDLVEVYRELEFTKTSLDLSNNDNEEASELILGLWDRITLSGDSIRTARSANFFVHGHNGRGGGQAERQGERQMVLAMYNKPLIDGLGTIIDYETPLQQPRPRGRLGANWPIPIRHGKIDMIIEDNGGQLLLVEAKDPRSRELAVRAVMEIYTYLKVLHINIQNFRAEAISNVGLHQNFQIRPAILTFRETHANTQLITRGLNFNALLGRISTDLKKMEFGPFVHITLNPYAADNLIHQGGQWMLQDAWNPNLIRVDLAL